MRRWILHADMNACYASIEQARRPALRGKAMAVCGDAAARNGIILAKSQEAKEAGVKTGEVIWQALQKCPQLILVPADFALYLAYSKLAHGIYLDYTPQVEPFGMDECWLDVSGSTALFGDGMAIAQTLRQRFRSELGITISVGVSDNKFFAKLGSDYRKPDGQTRIDQSNYQDIAWPLPVSDLLFCGPSTTRTLARFGFERIGDLAQADPRFIRRLLGRNGERLWLAANGRDKSPVSLYDFHPPIKSIGCGTTFRYDLCDRTEVAHSLLRLAQEVEKKLLRQDLAASALTLSIRDPHLLNLHESGPLPHPCQNAQELRDAALRLFDQVWTWRHRVRAMTLRAEKLLPQPQRVQTSFLRPFLRHEKREKLGRTLYNLRSRYGDRSVDFAALQAYDAADLSSERAQMPNQVLLSAPPPAATTSPALHAEAMV